MTLALTTLEAGISNSATNRWSWLTFSIAFKLIDWKWLFPFLFMTASFLAKQNENGNTRAFESTELAPFDHVTYTPPNLSSLSIDLILLQVLSQPCLLPSGAALTRFENCLLNKLHEFGYQLSCAPGPWLWGPDVGWVILGWALSITLQFNPSEMAMINQKNKAALANWTTARLQDLVCWDIYI